MAKLDICRETARLIELFKKEFGEKDWKDAFCQTVRIESGGTVTRQSSVRRHL